MKILETQTLEIPGYEGSEVVILKKPPWGSFEEINDKMNERQMGTKILPVAVLEWNFDDQNGKPLPINEATIRQLPSDVSKFLLVEVMKGSNNGLKKKTSDESPQSSEELK